MAENNSSTAALQIMQAERKHIFFFVFCFFFLRKTLRFTMWRRHECQIPLISQEFSLTLKVVFASLFKLMHVSIFICADILLCNEHSESVCTHWGGTRASAELRALTFPPPATSTHPSEPQGAWRPEGPQLPATPSALLEKRSPSRITYH